MNEPRIWIAQCLCPQRHAILAASGEADDQQAADRLIEPLRAYITMMLDSNAINPWCGLCKAPADTWSYEVKRTRFRSMAEAEPVLRQSERDQAIIRATFGDSTIYS